MKNIILALRERWRSGRRRTPERDLSARRPPERKQPSPIPVVLASACEDDRHSLRSLLQGTQWLLLEAAAWTEVQNLAGAIVSPVILCDRNLPGLKWQNGVSAVRAAIGDPCIILLSDVSDPYLWDELVQHGGFDVLTRPFQRADVLSLLGFAHTHWKAGRAEPARRDFGAPI